MAEAPTILYFHGNAGNISHRLVRIAQFRKHFNCSVLIVAYRGCASLLSVCLYLCLCLC